MDNMTVCIEEGESYKGFGPLTDTRAAWDLRCGAYTSAERIRMQVNRMIQLKRMDPSIRIVYRVRDYLAPLYRYIYGAENVNPELNDETNLIHFAPYSENQENDTETCCQVYSSDTTSGGYARRHRLKADIDTGVIPSYPWELFDSTGSRLADDLLLSKRLGMRFSSDTPDDVIVRHREDIYLEEDVDLGPGAILDASDGPVWIAEHAKIEAGAILLGPVYIGPHSIIRPGAKLSDGVCLGPHCRVGGEISRTIMQGHSNKQHSGYIGNSYIGSWVNLGAATDNSDLKNNYRPVMVTMNDQLIETGNLHIGSIIGDYVKTAIHTRLNTGTVIGICCNLFGNDFPPKEVPPFTWIGSDGSQEYRFDKAMETIRIVMSRRQCELTPAMEGILRCIFDKSSSARR